MMTNLKVAKKIQFGAQDLDFIGSGNVWVDNDFSPRTAGLARHILLQAFEGTAAGQLGVTVFDSEVTGVASPFAKLQDDSNILSFINTEAEFLDYLKFLKVHIQGVNNVIMGKTDSLIQFRELEPQCIESYKLVVIVLNMKRKEDDEILSLLANLMQVGPKAGVNFLIISTSIGVDEKYQKNTQIIYPDDFVEQISSVEIIDRCARFIKELSGVKSEPILFSEIQDLNTLWQENSADGITFSLGKYGTDVIEVTIGDEKNQRHNMLVTGAVGQGKSNLLAVIIHSMCQRYSPDEVELYLLDFKEGVSLQNYASTEKRKEYLPHAKVLGLESDVNFGIAVLNHLFGVYEDRMKLFKSVGCQNISQYRKKVNGAKLPRIVLIIDEFQMLFDTAQDKAKEAQAILSRSARLYRAAGIHIILASQTISQSSSLTKNSDLFAQMPIRIAHKNTISESEAVLSSGNAAATDLLMGQAIVNLDYGLISSNRKVSIAYANEETLFPIRKNWYNKAHAIFPPPNVYDSLKVPKIGEYLELLNFTDTENPTTLLSSGLSVQKNIFTAELSNEVGKNVAIFGAGNQKSNKQNMGIGILQSAAISLALYHHSKGQDALFVYCDTVSNRVAQDNNMSRFEVLMSNLGFPVIKMASDSFNKYIQDVATSLDNRSNEDNIYILGFEFDKLTTLDAIKFSEICQNGSARGVHILGWWAKFESFEKQTKYSSSLFDTKILLKLDEKIAHRISGSYGTWENLDNRGVGVSLDSDELISLVPFSSIEDVSIRKITEIYEGLC
ncbi:cell division protein FtsK [Actinomycetota bacterium]|nr:cell division protein FtsK [Actinomycetota bacterium]